MDEARTNVQREMDTVYDGGGKVGCARGGLMHAIGYEERRRVGLVKPTY